MERLAALAAALLGFVLEPGRHLVADHGVIQAHVVRLTERAQPGGGRTRWLVPERRQVQRPARDGPGDLPAGLPGRETEEYVPAIVAGPTCDSDDAYGDGRYPVRVPRSVRSGDPVRILAAGAYATSYMTQGFNGIRPLPCVCTRGQEGTPLT